MGKFLHFPSALNPSKPQISDHSSAETSLATQPSLPSVPSLQQPAAAAVYNSSVTIKPQSTYIFSLTTTGEHLYCGGADGRITVCDRRFQNPDLTPAANSSAAVKSIAISGDRVFAAYQDHKIRVWKIDGTSAGQPRLNKITVLPTLGDRCARLFSAKNYVEIRRHKRCTWVHHVDAVSALALSKSGSLLYSASWDRSFKVWRTSDFKCLESVQNAHEDAINAVVLSGDGFLYTGSADRKIKVWQKREGERKHSLVSTLQKHRSSVNALALSGDGSVLYSGACDRSIVVWEKDGNGGHMAVAGALRGHTKAILCLAVVSELLLSGSADMSVRVWRRGGGDRYSCLAVLEGHRSPVKCLAASLDCSDNNNGDCYAVYSGSLDCEVKVWQLDTF